MEGIAGIAVACEIGVGLCSPCLCCLFGFENDECRTLAEVQSGSAGVKGTARLVVEDHQRVETVEMETRQCFRSAGNDDVCLSGFE